MVQGLYSLWLARNEARDGKKIQDAREMANSTVYSLNEWRSAHVHSDQGAVQAQVQKWKPSDPRWIKINVHGATAKDEREVQEAQYSEMPLVHFVDWKASSFLLLAPLKLLNFWRVCELFVLQEKGLYRECMLRWIVGLLCP